MSNVTPQMMRETLRLWASGVSVVTSAEGGNYTGMTVSAFNSLSLEPPMILVCLSKNTHTADMVLRSSAFGVSILGEDQASISDRFAGRIPLETHEARFDTVATALYETGAPILADAISWLDCRVQTVHDGSTHWIVIGEVVATGCQGKVAPPLLYFNRAYRALTIPVEEAQP
jgi:flavin reductase (DIM6/NTAB) family NADH-FMN oxidoreductase RutF